MWMQQGPICILVKIKFSVDVENIGWNTEL